MKTVSFKGEITNAYGKKLSEYKDDDGNILVPGGELKYEGSYEAFENPGDVRTAGEWPSDSDVVKLVNNKRKAAAKAASAKATLEAAGIKAPTLESDVQLQLQTVYKALMAGGKHTEESARAKAAETIGAEWDDE